MQRFTYTILARGTGMALKDALVTIYVKDTADKATLYAENDTTGDTLANPLTSDAFGNIEAFVPDGTYDLRVDHAAQPTRTIEDVQIYDLEELAATTAGVGPLTNITGAANQIAYFAGDNIVQTVDFTQAARNLLDDTTVEEMRATLGVSAGGGNLIGFRVITATGAGIYNATPGTASIVIELQGAGGGGGGCVSPGAGNCAGGGNGGGGGYGRKRLTADFDGAAYVVGAAGVGGTAGANDGTAGGDTTFTDTAVAPTTYTAEGGGGSNGSVSGPYPFIFGGSGSVGTAINCDLAIPGGQVQRGVIVNNAATGGCGFGTGGGMSFYSKGASPAFLSAQNMSLSGGTAVGYGGGGAGGAAVGTGIARAGGAGSDGVIIIWEYS